MFAGQSSQAIEEIQSSWAVSGRYIVPTAEMIPDPDHWRIVAGAAVPRLAMAPNASTSSFAADGVAECVLSGLPSPCTATIHGAVSAGPMEVTGGSLTITSTAPGTIRVAVIANPDFLPWETTIYAT